VDPEQENNNNNNNTSQWNLPLDMHWTANRSMNNLGSFSEFSQDSYTDIFDRIDPDAEIRGRDLSDSCNNSDDGQVSGNVGDDGGGGYNNKDDDDDDED
jgi:hypothetical protein